MLEKARHDGGNTGFGWTIWEWRARVFLNAEFHAVWVLPDNELIDITSKPEGEARITFVSDESYPADFHHTKRPINRDCEESWT